VSELPSEEVTVTPERARTLLTRAAYGLVDERTRSFAAQMAAGTWEPGSELVLTRGDEGIFDGCHRLAAVALAGVPVRFRIRIVDHAFPAVRPLPLGEQGDA